MGSSYGPCRLGKYALEQSRALKEAGFDAAPETWQDVISMILKKETIPVGGRHPLFSSKAKRWYKAYRKRNERPVPHKKVRMPKPKKIPKTEEED